MRRLTSTLSAIAFVIRIFSSPVEAAESTWVLKDQGPPSGRSHFGMAFDSARAEVVIFGGSGNSPSGYRTLLGDTHTWNARVWRRPFPVTSPSPRSSHAMAFDPNRQRVVLFGGRTSQGLSNETWEWDGANWYLMDQSGPQAREGHSLAYDANRGGILLFGGRSESAIYADTWLWTGDRWNKASPSSFPQARFSHAASQLADGGVLIFGGHGPSGVRSDTWRWGGLGWSRLGDQAPTARHSHALALDPITKDVVMFGGQSGSAVLSDAWIWREGRWIPSGGGSPPHQGQTVPLPAARAGHGAVFDGAGVVMFGGYSSPSGDYCYCAGDAWRRSGETWRSLTVPASGMMIYDTMRQRTTLFAGVGGTWFWEGNGWRETEHWQPNLSSGGVVWDRNRQVAIAISQQSAISGPIDIVSGVWGSLNELRRHRTVGVSEWNGTSWVERDFISGPTSRWGFSFTHDSDRNRTIIFGGMCNDREFCDGDGYSSETWEWDGTAWILRQPAHTPSTYYPGSPMAYDTARKRAVLLHPSRTWEWDGLDWKAVNSTPPAWQPELVYHAGMGKVLALDRGTTWAWDGANWSLVAHEEELASRFSPELVFDESRGRVVLHSGWSEHGSNDEKGLTWES